MGRYSVIDIAATMAASGFYEIPTTYNHRVRRSSVPIDPVRFLKTFFPCPLGTFSNYSSQGAEGCIPCPPGMLWVYMHRFLNLIGANKRSVFYTAGIGGGGGVKEEHSARTTLTQVAIKVMTPQLLGNWSSKDVPFEVCNMIL